MYDFAVASVNSTNFSFAHPSRSFLASFPPNVSLMIHLVPATWLHVPHPPHPSLSLYLALWRHAHCNSSRLFPATWKTYDSAGKLSSSFPQATYCQFAVLLRSTRVPFSIIARVTIEPLPPPLRPVFHPTIVFLSRSRRRTAEQYLLLFRGVNSGSGDGWSLTSETEAKTTSRCTRKRSAASRRIRSTYSLCPEISSHSPDSVSSWPIHLISATSSNGWSKWA